MRNFKELEVWKLGMDIVTDIYRIMTELPIDERFGLNSQLTRAAVSIPSNIAEGSAKDSEKEFRKYIERAHGSSFEGVTQLLSAAELGLLNEEETKELISKIVLEQKKLGSFFL